MKRTFVSILSLILLFALAGCFALEEPEAASGDAEAESVEAVEEATVYTIDSEQSEARFLIDEVLRGEDVTVVGVSNNVAGEIAVDFDNPSTATVGEIVINARNFATDNNFRNNAVQGRILRTNDYEFVTFTPTSLSGLPDTITIGAPYTFQILGALTTTDVTNEVTFEATVTPTSETELTGLATADILYADWNLTIPFSQAVDAVEDNVILELEFVATAQ